MTYKSKATLIPGRMSEPMGSGVQCRPAIDLLPAARANGVRRYTIGLSALLCRAEPIEALPGRGRIVAGGLNVTIQPVGKPISSEAAARLLDFATTYFEGEGAT